MNATAENDNENEHPIPVKKVVPQNLSWCQTTQFEPWQGEECPSSITADDVKHLGEPCRFILRCRQAQTPWEGVVRAVVGNPVHVDTVLARPGSASAKFCFSSYMSQKFEMAIMKPCMVHDSSICNFALHITEEEHERCTHFLTALEGKASYSYFDAMVLMPMAPKPYDTCSTTVNQGPGRRLLLSMFNVLADDDGPSDPAKIKKIFCSQSVVLMLRWVFSEGQLHGYLNNAELMTLTC